MITRTWGRKPLIQLLSSNPGATFRRRVTAAARPLLQRLALVPDALADVAGHRRLERDLHRLRLAPGDAEGAPRVFGDVEVGGHLEGLVRTSIFSMRSTAKVRTSSYSSARA